MHISFLPPRASILHDPNCRLTNNPSVCSHPDTAWVVWRFTRVSGIPATHLKCTSYNVVLRFGSRKGVPSEVYSTSGMDGLLSVKTSTVHNNGQIAKLQRLFFHGASLLTATLIASFCLPAASQALVARTTYVLQP